MGRRDRAVTSAWMFYVFSVLGTLTGLFIWHKPSLAFVVFAFWLILVGVTWIAIRVVSRINKRRINSSGLED